MFIKIQMLCFFVGSVFCCLYKRIVGTDAASDKKNRGCMFMLRVISPVACSLLPSCMSFLEFHFSMHKLS